MPPVATAQRALVPGLLIPGRLLAIFFGWRAFHLFENFNNQPVQPPARIETNVELMRDQMPFPYITHMYGKDTIAIQTP